MPNLNEPMRAEFEQFRRSTGTPDYLLVRADGEYCFAVVNADWTIWQAATEAANRRQHGSAAQAVAIPDMLGELSRWAPDRYGNEMECCPDGIYVRLDDVRGLIETASQRDEMNEPAPPVADAEGVKAVQALPNPYNSAQHGENWQASAHAWDECHASVIRALSRRPAAEPAEELTPKDVNVLRRWAEQIERMASLFDDERSLLCQQVAVLMHRIAYKPAEAAEQPAAAGNALTDEQSHAEFMRHFPMPEGLRASVYDAWQHDQLRRKEGWEAAIKHLRAAPQAVWTQEMIDQVNAEAERLTSKVKPAPQAAQGEGLTDEQYQYILRPVLSRIGMKRYLSGDPIELHPSDYRTIIKRAIAAHTRASDGKDAVFEAARKLVNAKGRYHTELNYTALADALAAMQQAASNQQEGEK